MKSKKILQNIPVKWLALLLAGGAIFAVLLYWLHLPALAHIESMQQEILLNEKNLQRLEVYRRSEQAKTSYRETLLKKERLLNKALPAGLDQSAFLTMLQQTALSKNIAISEVSPEKISVSGEIKILPVKLKLTGNYFSLLDFWRELYNQPRYFNLRQVVITAKDNKLECELLLVIYAINNA